jgi:effector-binding domain-containing protein
VPTAFAESLDQVYSVARTGAIAIDGQNIFVYRSVPGSADQVDVEFGVGVKAPFEGLWPVEYCTLPVGEVATTTHWGDYARLGAAHEAVIAWCRAQNRSLAGPRWEVYGHWREGEVPRTDVFYLLAPAVHPDEPAPQRGR